MQKSKYKMQDALKLRFEAIILHYYCKRLICDREIQDIFLSKSLNIN